MSSVITSKRQFTATQEDYDNPSKHMSEVTAICPNCKTMETLWFIGHSLVQTRKFSQQGNRVFHDCGSEEPCRLLPRLLDGDVISDLV